MRQLVVEYVALHRDTRTGDYVRVQYDRHPEGMATVAEQTLEVMTTGGQGLGGYADGVWRRWWYEDQNTSQPSQTAVEPTVEDRE